MTFVNATSSGPGKVHIGFAIDNEGDAELLCSRRVEWPTNVATFRGILLRARRGDPASGVSEFGRCSYRSTGPLFGRDVRH